MKNNAVYKHLMQFNAYIYTKLHILNCIMYAYIYLYTVYPHPFAVHRSLPRILSDFALKVFKVISEIS